MNNNDAWIQQVKANGYGPALQLALDALEPVGPLGAQFVWAFQPLLGVFVGRDALQQLAYALERPEELERLREALADDDSEHHPPETAT